MRPPKSSEQIGRVTDGGIGRDTRETVGASALEAHTQICKRRRRTLSFVRFDEPEKSLPDGFRHHCGFRAAALLLEDD